MGIPMLQHTRWRCQFGGVQHLSFFLSLCTAVSCDLVFFLFVQAFVLAPENNRLLVAIRTVTVEGPCGTINAIQSAVANGSLIVLLFPFAVMLSAQHHLRDDDHRGAGIALRST